MTPGERSAGSLPASGSGWASGQRSSSPTSAAAGRSGRERRSGRRDCSAGDEPGAGRRRGRCHQPARFATGKPRLPSAASSNACSNAASTGRRRRDRAPPRGPSVMAQTTGTAIARRPRPRSSSRQPRLRVRKSCRAASAGSAGCRSGATATGGPAQARNMASATPTTPLAVTLRGRPLPLQHGRPPRPPNSS